MNLTNYAGQIRAEHELAKAKVQEATQHAINCGNYLSEVKDQIQHGQFTDWVRTNCHFSMRTAQIYMRLASKAQRVAHLPIRRAMETLAAPRAPKPQQLSVFGSAFTDAPGPWPGFPVPEAGQVTRWVFVVEANRSAWLELRCKGDGYYDLAVRSFELSEQEMGQPSPKWLRLYVKSFGLTPKKIECVDVLTHYSESDLNSEYGIRLAWNIVASNFSPSDASLAWRAARQSPYLGNIALMRELQAKHPEVRQ